MTADENDEPAERAQDGGESPGEARPRKTRKKQPAVETAPAVAQAEGAPRQLAVPRGLLVTLLGALTALAGVLHFAFGSGASAGAWCMTADDCRSGLCITSGDSGTCADPCAVDDDCPADRVCRFVGGERVCWRAAHVAVGERCDDDSDCIDGACVSLMRIEDMSARCAVHCRGGLCDEGFVCVDERCLPREFVGLPPPRHPHPHDAGPAGAR